MLKKIKIKKNKINILKPEVNIIVNHVDVINKVCPKSGWFINNITISSKISSE